MNRLHSFPLAGARPLLLALFLVLLGSILQVQAQTPGLIFQPATGTGRNVLDPNLDNYTSKTSAGYTGTSDIGAANNEIVYRLLPQLTSEPDGDLATGSAGGHTDLVANPLYMAFNGNQVLFRVRVGGNSTASKGYSFLIDSDGVFNKQRLANGTLVDYTTPSKVKNFGFEYEVVLALNFDVVIYKHRGSGDDADPFTSNVIWRGSANGGYSQYFQKAVAASRVNGNADYFFDFYVPLSAFSADGGAGLSPSAPLRVTASTVTSAQTGLEGTVSDVGGVNDLQYANDRYRIWRDVIPAFPPTSLNQLQAGEFCQTAAPAAPQLTTFPITTATSSFTGTSSENGGEITLFINGERVTTATPITVNNNSFTFALPSGITLVAGDIITARVTRAASGNCPAVTSISSPSYTVTNIVKGQCATSAPTNIRNGQGSKQLIITHSSNALTSSTLRVYRDGNYLPGVVSTPKAVTGAFEYTFTLTTNQNQFEFSYNGSTETSYATITASAVLNGCESPRSTSFYFDGNKLSTTPTSGKTSNIPTITSTIICSTNSVLRGTAEPGSLIYLYIDNEPALQTADGSIVASATASAATVTGGTGTWSIDLRAFTIARNEVITVKAKAPGTIGTNNPNPWKGLSASSTGVTLGTNCVTATPAIASNTLCPTATTISGTSSEAAGTTIIVYRRVGTSPVPASDPKVTEVATVANGNWSASVLPNANLRPNDVLYAVATAPSGKTVSAASTTVTVAAFGSNTGLTLSSPIKERATLITGTSSTNGTINIYIDGQRIGGSATVTNATTNAPVTWSIAINATTQLNLVAGASVTATLLPSSGNVCESQQTVAVPVTCSAPANTPVLATAALVVCQNSPAVLTLNNTQDGVIYQVYNGTEPSGPSMVGNGGSITLSSKALTAAAVLTIRAFNVNSPDCQTTLTSSASVTIGPSPQVFSVSSAPANVCNGSTATVTLSDSEEGVSYQLQVLDPATSTYAATGVAVPGTKSAITLTSGPITRTGSFKVVAILNGCSTDMGAAFTITVPSNTLAISPSAQAVCSGQPVSVTLQNSENGVVYQIQRISGTGPDFTYTNRGAAVTGNGGLITLTTDALVVAGNNAFRILATAPNCATPFALTQGFSVNVTGTTLTTSYTVSPTTQSLCSGSSASLTLSGSDLGTTYQIISPSGAPTGTAVLGTGNAITLTTGALATGGTFSVRATNACGGSQTLTNTATVTVNPQPVAYTLTPASLSICNGGTTSISVATSQQNITYALQVYNAGTNSFSTVGTTLAGTGASLSFTTPVLTQSTTLRVVATSSSSCTTEMLNRVFLFVPSSTMAVEAVTPSICSGGVAQIRVKASETEVYYQLRANGSNVGAAIEGTGGDIILTSGPLSASTTFSVAATTTLVNGTTPQTCTFSLPTNLSVAVAAPVAQTSELVSALTLCSGSIATIRLTGSEAGVNYQIYNGTIPIGLGVVGTGSSITLTSDPLTSNANLRVRAIRSGCGTVEVGTAYVITVSPTPIRLSFNSVQQTICAGSTVSINLPSSQNNIFYQIFNGATPSGIQVKGTGGTITLVSGPINASTTLTVRAIVAGGCGNVAMEGVVTVTVPQIVANAGTNQRFCAGIPAAPKTVTMNATSSTNGTGIWTLVKQPGGTPTLTITNPTNPTTTISGLTAGEYVFRWTVTFSNCGAASEEVTITMDCPIDSDARMVIDNSGKPADSYSTGETLFTFTDADASIHAFYVSETDAIPGVSFELVNGTLRMYVSNVSSLKASFYKPTIRTTDALGGVSYLTPELVIGTPLPVTLTHFAVVAKHGNITLNWTTASEKDNDYFLVERSQDGKNFSGVGKVQGNGTTNVLQNYSFQDDTAPAGTLYYRLKQIDYDGKFEYSKVVSVKTIGTAGPTAQLKIVRNPFKEVVQVEIKATQSETVQMELVDLRGKVLLREELRVTTGTTNWQHHTATLPSGVYLLKVIGNTIKEVTRVVKVD